MAHQMQNNDAFVAYKHAAWHGLGEVVDRQMSPHEALKIGGADWQVVQQPLHTLDINTQQIIEVPTHVVNVRSDDQTQLGVVRSSWQPINNTVLADFAVALGEVDDEVFVETVGTIKGGRVCYVLVRSESYVIGTDEDEVKPYLLLCVGHDGSMAFRGQFTSIRVVCANTLAWALNQQRAAFTIPHTVNVDTYINEAKSALGLFTDATASQRDASLVLAGRDVSREDLQAFWLDVYTRDFGAIPATPINKREETKKNKAIDAMAAIADRFDRERDVAGANAWNAFNAYTGYVQNERKTRVTAAESKLFGKAAERSSDAFAVAMKTFA